MEIFIIQDSIDFYNIKKDEIQKLVKENIQENTDEDEKNKFTEKIKNLLERHIQTNDKVKELIKSLTSD
jgi:DNA-binding transcriptional regulator GbsR (MarR family)